MVNKPKKTIAFLEINRQDPKYRPINERVQDYLEIPEPMTTEAVQEQSARCMDCGVPFCHQGCPLGNVIPDFNDLVYENRWREALDVLLSTNNYPEFTGRVCPAPCESSCVLGINADPVSIKQIEVAIIDRAFAEGWITPRPPLERTGKRVAVIGSGPAGMACAEQLNRAGHHVVIFDKNDRAGGLLIYGIPDFKMDKSVLTRRLELMIAEGIEFRLSCEVGQDVSLARLQQDFDAVVLAIGAENPRELNLPGSDLEGVHFAMDFLTQQNRRLQGDDLAGQLELTAQGKTVIIIGGGDTGSDCLGTSIRQGAADIIQFEHKPAPPKSRPPGNLWPQQPMVWLKSTSHEEGGKQEFSISTKAFEGSQGKLERIRVAQVAITYDEQGQRLFNEVAGSEYTIDTQLVLIAAGFTGPVMPDLAGQLNFKLTRRGNLWTDGDKMTSVPGIFAAGDAVRGQSLVVWAIAEGRDAARGIDKYLTGKVRLPGSNTTTELLHA